ncbi:siderophore ABC transporter substrate-binding protein [Enterovibrio sp. ZSDZ35]|uniref:Siderophore ABC transporter substrate-binding protein n=1 Tax=Enterovibrio qingdaonensis TaxID=2899818 RepID=A0ABT5QTL1_9GAMM|nr:siderophore ABC transporter substrate-binding protein [Enterovibrio sp. ZSDZ35]MDD1784315.1 siderophore ABC transporter substrate-binding protein [Enterovibrio sp. ZSDZ35]
MKHLFLTGLISLLSIPFAFAEKVTVKHLMGTTTIDGIPKRAVVIGLGAMDAVNALGIEPVAVSKTLPQTPAYLEKFQSKQYANAGSLFEPNFEEIYTQQPDIIIVGPRSSSRFEELSKIAPTVVFAANSDKGYWQATQEQWRNLGQIFGKEALVEQKILVMNTQIDAIRSHNQATGNDALTVMSSGGKLTSFGADSRFSAIYQDFGFKETVEDITVSTHGDMMSFEFIREANPKTLLIIDRDTLIDPTKSTTRESFNNALVKATRAYQTDKVTYLDLNAWYLSMSGITATEQMIKDIQRSISL